MRCAIFVFRVVFFVLRRKVLLNQLFTEPIIGHYVLLFCTPVTCIVSDKQLFGSSDDIVGRESGSGRTGRVVVPPRIISGYLNKACEIDHIIVTGRFQSFRVYCSITDFEGQTWLAILPHAHEDNRSHHKEQDRKLRVP